MPASQPQPLTTRAGPCPAGAQRHALALALALGWCLGLGATSARAAERAIAQEVLVNAPIDAAKPG